VDGTTSPAEKAKRGKEPRERAIDNSIVDDLKCPVCQETPKDVTTTPCGHNFCTACIQKSRETNERRNNHCAVCREPLGTWKPRINLTLSAIISKQDVQCPYDECKQIVKLKDFDNHKEKCLFRPIVCNRCQQNYLLSNKDTHSALCTRTPCNSESRGCTFKGMVGEVKKHMTECHFELNRWLIDLFTNEVKASIGKLSHDMNTKFDAMHDRINTIAYQVDELARVVHNEDGLYDEEDNYDEEDGDGDDDDEDDDDDGGGSGDEDGDNEVLFT